MSEREALRARGRAAREAIPALQRTAHGEAIARRVLDLPEVRRAASLFAYLAIGAEAPTRDLVERWWRDGKAVAVPRLVGPGQMEAHRVHGWDDLEPGRYGILSPRRVDPLPPPIDIALVPCVAISPAGNRLGMGAGYYDRFLARHAVGVTIALAHEAQVVDAVPHAPHDVPVDMVVTEVRIIRCEKALP